MTTSPPSNQQRACVCYTIDEGYLLPALVSAIQARRHVPEGLADIIVVVIGERTDQLDAPSRVAESNGIQLVYRDKADIDARHPMFARLYLAELLPAGYERIVYIDGDTQIREDLSPLIEVPIEAGHFLACRDPAVIFSRLSEKWSERVAEDRRHIEYGGNYDNYFNSGVLVFDRSSWRSLSAACFDLMDQNLPLYRYPDQDILNIAIGSQCKLISNRWNFPGFLIGSAIEKQTRPHIYHFMSNPRPWIVSVRPWNRGWAQPYDDLIRKYPGLEAVKPTVAPIKRLRYWLQQNVKMITEYGPVGKLSEPPADLAI